MTKTSPTLNLTPARLDALHAVAAGKVAKHFELRGVGQFWMRDRRRVTKTPYEWLRTNGLIRPAAGPSLHGSFFEPTDLARQILDAAAKEADAR